MDLLPLSLTPEDLPASHFLQQKELRNEVTAVLRRAQPRARILLDRLRTQPSPTSAAVFAPAGFGRLSQPHPVGLDYAEWEQMLETLTEFDPLQLEEVGQSRLLSIVLDIVRPSFLVVDDRASFDSVSHLPVDTLAYWRNRIESRADLLTGVYQAVGRIDVQNHETKTWCGTGWLVRSDVLVTNRHVAEDFQQSTDSGWTFRRSIDGQPLSAALDFAHDPDGGTDTESCRITEILHIESGDGPDVAFLRTDSDRPRGPTGDGLSLAEADEISASREVLAIGYPRYDSSSPEPAEMVRRLFGARFNVKRAAPGTITAKKLGENYVTHDCSTLNRSSGSAIVDLGTGKSVGLHMGGKLLRGNYAVTSVFLAERMKTLGL